MGRPMDRGVVPGVGIAMWILILLVWFVLQASRGLQIRELSNAPLASSVEQHGVARASQVWKEKARSPLLGWPLRALVRRQRVYQSLCLRLKNVPSCENCARKGVQRTQFFAYSWTSPRLCHAQAGSYYWRLRRPLPTKVRKRMSS